VYGQPLVVNGEVIAATEQDSVYAFDLATGSLRWRVHLAGPVSRSSLPCGDIDPLGITGTPAYDAAAGSVFVVTESSGGVHDLVALDATTGRTRFQRNVDVGGHDPNAQQQRGALAVADGRVYIPFGGLFGDCGDYVGYVAAVATNGSGTTLSYAVPTQKEGGIWAPPGPAVGPDGTIYVSVGNGAATGGAYDGSDSVVRLSADLSRRLDFFAPSGWARENASDQDLGSTGPVLLQDGMMVASGKNGHVYLLDGAHLGGIGGQVASVGGCTGFGGMAAAGTAVFVPCAEGLQRFDVNGRALNPGWRVSATGSPVVGGGAVWALDTGTGTLDAFDESTGRPLASVDVGPVTRFASPVVVGTRAIVGTDAGVVVATTT
jgi:outer membrane protein assembly factor BamB